MAAALAMMTGAWLILKLIGYALLANASAGHTAMRQALVWGGPLAYATHILFWICAWTAALTVLESRTSWILLTALLTITLTLAHARLFARHKT